MHQPALADSADLPIADPSVEEENAHWCPHQNLVFHFSLTWNVEFKISSQAEAEHAGGIMEAAEVDDVAGIVGCFVGNCNGRNETQSDKCFWLLELLGRLAPTN